MHQNSHSINNFKFIIISYLFLVISSTTYSQKDSVSITNYKNNIVLYNDLGFNTAPFNIETNYKKLPVTIKFRNNIHDFYGVGGNYKWLSFRLNIQLPGSILSTKDYGLSKYFHLGFDFTYKKVFFDVDFYRYKGFALMDAFQYNPSKFNNDTPNDIQSNLVTKSFSINMWYFHKNNFSMDALRGKTAIFNTFSYTWYLKGTINSFGLNNNDSPILPAYLFDATNSKTGSNSIRAFDIGLVPGIAFVYVKNNWSYNVLAGYGAVIQEKSYKTNDFTRYFIGLAPRYDIRVMGGYNNPKWFLMLHTDFDNKSIQFTSLKYTQTYFNIRLVGGYRFNTKNKDIKKKYYFF